jgi:hypothetical protein
MRRAIASLGRRLSARAAVARGKILGVVSRGDFKGVAYGHHEDERDLWEHMR